MSDTWFVKLYRKILSNAISKNLEFLGLFSALLLKANHKENNFYLWYKKVVVKPWQFVSSVRKLATEFKVSVNKMYRMLEVLKLEHIVEHQWCWKYSLFTIVNRDKYQLDRTQDRTVVEHIIEHKWNTNKNDKNDKEWKEDIETPPKPKKKFVPPTIEQVKQFFQENGYLEKVAIHVWNYYKDADWHDRNGDKVLNRKQKIRANWFKDENKDKTKSRGLTEAQRQERLDALSN